MKVIKWGLVTLLALIVCLALYLTFLFDLNDYKPELVSLVKEQTGRELKIEKDLKWTVYPSLGIEIEKLSLSAPKGFKQQMLSVNKAVAEVKFLPLLSKQVEISRLNFDGIIFNLITKKDGKSSLDGLGGSASEKSAVNKNKVDDKATDEAPGQMLNALHINGISITDVTVNMRDDNTKVANQFNIKKLSLDDFDLDKDSKLAFEIQADINKNQITSSGSGVININKSLSTFALKSLEVETNINGTAIPNGKIENRVQLDAQVDTKAKTATLKLDSFDIDAIKSSGKAQVSFGKKVPYINASLNVGDVNITPYLPKEKEAKETTKQPLAATPSDTNKLPGTEPDLGALNTVNADISLKVKAIQFKKIKTNDWNLESSLKGGVLNVKDFSGHLYKGKLASSASLLAKNGKPNYKFRTTLSGVRVQPLLKDAINSEILAGTTLFNLSGHGTSLNPDKVLENLVAQGNAEFTDGAIYGVNIPLMIRNAKAKFKGEATEEVKQKKTDFTRLGTKFKIVKGVVKLNETEMASPLLRLKGEGDVNLVKKSIDYLLQTEIVASLKGQKSKKDDLSGIKIPLRISGEMTNPKFSIDTKALLDEKIDQEKEKLKNKIKDKLFKKFGF
ncbi:AsmA family protein [Shewanella sp. OPT22]|nr:AsmA family protein [Shewanella sp. OPT22]